MTAAAAVPSRDDLATLYFDQLQYPPYPVQEDALLKWFSSDEGVLVAAPTGTGKTLIAEGAAFEALHTRKVVYYTTPLIALTEQKFAEMQAAAARWGFPAEDVGLVTGHRKVNPNARVLVVVAEILLNRLLHDESAHHFDDCLGVVMDEFHSFADRERGAVWEFSLSMLPAHVRLLLLSATIGNAKTFLGWLGNCHGRRLEYATTTERKVPLQFEWVGDKLLADCIEDLATGDDDTRRTPALLFCFNREECWSVAEELKGRALLAEGQQKQLAARLAEHDFTKGAGPKLKQILIRGIGVHHAGVLPRHKRLVESLFQEKLLTICVCTETLAAGINLPARSVVLPTLLKGPAGAQKLLDTSSAHQIFGRAGRPQYDTKGYVFALPHEDDVRIAKWKEKYDQIPEDTKDPLLIKAKKAMKKKMPTRSTNRQYWNDSQFEKLRVAPARDLASQGNLPWRLLAYLLSVSPDFSRLEQLCRKRLMEPARLEQSQTELVRMLITLHHAGFVMLDPPPPIADADKADPAATGDTEVGAALANGTPPPPAAPVNSWLSQQLQAALDTQREAQGKVSARQIIAKEAAAKPDYKPVRATPTDRMPLLLGFRGVNPIYAAFLLEQMALADATERLLLLESVLELPRSLIKFVRVPNPERLPPGPLALEKIDALVVEKGLLPAADLYPQFDPDIPFEDRKYAPTLAEKVKWVFDAEFPHVSDLSIMPVYVANDLLQFGGSLVKYIGGRDLAKQEGIILRHLLRLILLLGEFRRQTPPGCDPDVWRSELKTLMETLQTACDEADPDATRETMQAIAEASAAQLQMAESEAVDFGEGLW